MKPEPVDRKLHYNQTSLQLTDYIVIVTVYLFFCVHNSKTIYRTKFLFSDMVGSTSESVLLKDDLDHESRIIFAIFQQYLHKSKSSHWIKVIFRHKLGSACGLVLRKIELD